MLSRVPPDAKDKECDHGTHEAPKTEMKLWKSHCGKTQIFTENYNPRSEYAPAFDKAGLQSINLLKYMTVQTYMEDFKMTKIHANKLKKAVKKVSGCMCEGMNTQPSADLLIHSQTLEDSQAHGRGDHPRELAV